jgi:hypothetical protein
MNRLRVRVELNRRKTGVPMDELVSVVEETRKFFHLLAEDVEIPVDRGEWQASNFDPESLNFTAEFSGPASAEQIRAFGSAFGGTTSLRRETIAQFTHIADFIGEDELVGFGLYQSDQETEPSDWRCLSRRDASRFADEILLLAKAAGDSVAPAPLPAVMNGSVGGRRLFKDQRERAALATDPSKWIRDVESSLSRRISLLESEAEAQAHKIHGLGNTQEAADERFLKLLGAMESFWSQAPRQLPPIGPEPPPHATASQVDLASAPLPSQTRRARRPWRLGLPLTAAALVLAIGTLEMGRGWPRRTTRTEPTSSKVQPPVDTSNAHLLNSAGGPSTLPAGQETTISPGSASPPPDNSSQAQVGRARSESGVGAQSGVGSPRHATDSEMIRQISLEVPTDLRGMIREQVLINVTVNIDRTGKVTGAEVASTRGPNASLLATEALKAARWFRFRPNRQGSKAALSQTVLTFVFDPQTEALLPEVLPPGN